MIEQRIRLLYIPKSVYRAVKARNVNLEGLAQGTPEAFKALNTMERALLHACQHFQPLTNVLGSEGYVNVNYQLFAEKEIYTLLGPARDLAHTEGVQTALLTELSGEAGDDLCIEVIEMGPGCVGVVFGAGAIDALTKDNNVLTLLRNIVEKGLLFCNPEQLAMSYMGNLFTRFIKVSAYANTVTRPPSPVYK